VGAQRPTGSVPLFPGTLPSNPLPDRGKGGRGREGARRGREPPPEARLPRAPFLTKGGKGIRVKGGGRTTGARASVRDAPRRTCPNSFPYRFPRTPFLKGGGECRERGRRGRKRGAPNQEEGDAWARVPRRGSPRSVAPPTRHSTLKNPITIYEDKLSYANHRTPPQGGGRREDMTVYPVGIREYVRRRTRRRGLLLQKRGT